MQIIFSYFLFRKMFRNKFNICSYIELDTTNPIPVFKITICFTKYTNNATIVSKFGKFLEHFNKPNVCILYYL